MQVLDIGTGVYVKATIIGIDVDSNGKISYRVNVPSFGNFYCSDLQMSEVSPTEEEKTTPKENAHWKKMPQ